MKVEEYHPARGMETAVGVDAGATLAKLTVRTGPEQPKFRLVPSHALEAVAEHVHAARPERVGLTGGGAAELAARLRVESTHVNEFAAWGSGAAALLAHDGGAPEGRYLLVSLGTGTSVLLVDGMSVTRVGGTALGGGTLLGLAVGLFGPREFDELAGLAVRGRRAQVDLRVSDIYRAGEIPLAGDLTAANFGKLGAQRASGERPTAEDLAHALMGLVGENVALVCAGLAAAHQVRRIVYAGSTLRGNPTLVQILETVTRALGREPHFLRDGEFAGSLGALLLADQAA